MTAPAAKTIEMKPEITVTENECLSVLELFKENIMKYNKKENKIFEVFRFVDILICPKGYLMKESEKIFDLDEFNFNTQEKKRFLKDQTSINKIHRNAVSIITRAKSGKDFEKLISGLLNKIEKLPENIRIQTIAQIQQGIVNLSATPKSNEISIAALKIHESMNKVHSTGILQTKEGNSEIISNFLNDVEAEN